MSTLLLIAMITSTVKSSGNRLRLVDDADDDAALVHERAFVQAGRRLEMDGRLVAAARADVGEEQENGEQRRPSPRSVKRPTIACLVHIGIGPTSLPCKNCCTIGFGEPLISSTCAVGDDRTFEEHGDVVGHLENALQIVRNDDRGAVRACPQADDQVGQDVGDDRVEPGRGFVVEHAAAGW